MNLIFLGPPGSGKGTQSKIVGAKFNLPQISTGEIFRAAMKEGTEMGEKAKAYIERGDLVPDQVVVGIVADRLREDDCKAGFMLDGFPRTIPQADALGKVLADDGRKLDHVVQIDVPDSDLMERLTARRVCKACGEEFNTMYKRPKVAGVCDKCGGEIYQRSDDNEESIGKRLTEYHKQTKPLINYYAKQDLIRPIEGVGSIDDISSRVAEVLKG